jgi:triosephosphate isomerase
MRIPVIAGNWKMNPPSLADATRLALGCREVADRRPDVTTVICPPAIWLAVVRRAAGGGGLHIGAQ